MKKIKRKVRTGVHIKGEIICTLQHIKTGEKITTRYQNMVVDVAHTMMAKRLANKGNDCNITYCAVGTDNTTPVAGDTTLKTEINRQVVASGSYSGNVATLQGFFGAAQANGALKEVGWFGEAATTTPDSGTLFDRSLIDATKTSSYTLTITLIITIS